MAQFIKQCEAVAITLVWSGVMSFILLKVIDAVIGLRVTRDQEMEGLDIVLHGETMAPANRGRSATAGGRPQGRAPFAVLAPTVPGYSCHPALNKPVAIPWLRLLPRDVLPPPRSAR